MRRLNESLMPTPPPSDFPAINDATALGTRTALVTGSSRGIGRAIAVGLADVGADVVVNYCSNKESAERTVSEIEECGQEAITVQADISDEDELVDLVETTESTLGPVDILVNNAGIAHSIPIDNITRSEWERHIATNLTAAFQLIQAVLPTMREQGWGRILNISSVAAKNGGLTGPPYAASKAGLIGLTRSYARILAREGITVNAILPGLIETKMVEDSPVTPDSVPIGRFGTPVEVARVVQLIACHGFITGQTINVDGGIYFN